jgi:DnaJ-class molecular chaperone
MINKRYNKKKKCHITLKDGERFCPNCDGAGSVRSPGRIIRLTCHICNGDGKLDWIEQATGKKRKVVYMYER